MSYAQRVIIFNCFLASLRSAKKLKKGEKIILCFFKNKLLASKGKKQVALLAQIRVFDSKRIIKHFSANIPKSDFENIKQGLKNILAL